MQQSNNPFPRTVLAIGVASLLSGCPTPGKVAKPNLTTVTVAPGVVYERDESSGISLIDVDLSVAQVTPVVAVANIQRIGNNSVGDAKSVHDWLIERNAIAGINGGFFGETYDNIGSRKQIVGLCVAAGKVVAPGTRTISQKHPGERFLRTAIGFGRHGTPDIAYATGTKSAGVRRYADPLDKTKGAPWKIVYGVACGPRLFVRGQARITDTEERLVSPGSLPRSWIGYDNVNGIPKHLIFGCADSMTYARLAEAITDIFNRRHAAAPHDAMCLDGGGSCQIGYRVKSAVTDAYPNSTTVPTAILLVPKQATTDAPATPDEAVQAEYRRSGG